MNTKLELNSDIFNRVHRLESVKNYQGIDQHPVIQYLIEFHMQEKTDLQEVLNTMWSCGSKRLAAALTNQISATLPQVLQFGGSHNKANIDNNIDQTMRFLDAYYWELIIRLFDIKKILTPFNIRLLTPYIQKYTDQPNIEFNSENINKLFSEITELFCSDKWIQEFNRLIPNLTTKTFKNGNIEIILRNDNVPLSKYDASSLFKYFGYCLIANSHRNWVERISNHEIEKVESWDDNLNKVELVEKPNKLILKLNDKKAETLYQLTGFKA